MRAVADPLGAHALRPAELQSMVRALGEGDPLLVYRDEAGTLQVCRLAPGSRLTIGRRSESDLALGWDAQVSKVHAEVYELAREWVVEDDGLSSYGTFVNDTRVLARHRLRDQDRLRVGQTTLVFRHQPAGAAQELHRTIGPADQSPLRRAREGAAPPRSTTDTDGPGLRGRRRVVGPRRRARMPARPGWA